MGNLLPDCKLKQSVATIIKIVATLCFCFIFDIPLYQSVYG